MITIEIICVGKIKEAFYRDAIAEYAKRLQRYCKLIITELPDEKTPENASEALCEQIKAKEGQRILSRLDGKARVIALAIDGRKYDSVSFSRKLAETAVMGQSKIQFIIGGSLGLSPEVLREAKEHISFSDMTFPHQLMRVILLEQIYRGYRIISGEPYHK